MTIIPDLDANGNLLPGIYRVLLRDIENHLTWSANRKRLFRGLKEALQNLATAGVVRVWIDASFVTSKDEPNDVDGFWEYEPSMDADKLGDVFLDFAPPREAMRRKYGVDSLISGMRRRNERGQTVGEFFQVDRDNNRRGILLVEIGQQQ